MENLKAQGACWKGLVAVRGQVSVAMWNHPQDDLTSIGGELTKDKQPCTMHFVHGPDVAWHTAACSWLFFVDEGRVSSPMLCHVYGNPVSGCGHATHHLCLQQSLP